MARTKDLHFLDLLFQRIAVILDMKTLERLATRAAEWASDPELRGKYAKRYYELEEKLAMLLEPPEDSADQLSYRAIGEQFGLDDWELQVLAIAAAPRFDIQFEDYFARFHLSSTRSHCTVGMCLHLLFATREQRWRRRNMFVDDSPLVESGLIRLTAAPGASGDDLMERAVVACDFIFDALVGELPAEELATYLRIQSRVAARPVSTAPS
ncbi:MAG: hypothetical protein AAGC55_16055 [Myxococcota bacterium]